MRILLIGYGKMGQAIEKIALEHHHTIAYKIRNSTKETLEKINPAEVDVAIEFTEPTAAISNIKFCMDHRIPIVCGTTGWNSKWKEIEEYCSSKKGSLFYASNFSIGVYLFLYINEKLSKAMNNYSEYNIEIEETHHTQKKDIPSGTAITLAETILSQFKQKKSWTSESTNDPSQLLIHSKREYDVIGTHSVHYHSSVDTITIEHIAHSRMGFVIGALKAAEWIQGKTGIFGMKDLLNL